MDNHGASALPTGLGAPEGAEPCGLGASPAIPCGADYEAWRPALAAFYRSECSFQSAENVKRGDPLTLDDMRVIKALQAAFITQSVAA